MNADFTPLGLAVGHATDRAGGTGCTVVRRVEGASRVGSAIFGRATGTRELHAATPGHLADRADAILLTGGSAYGLDAAAGVMRWMEERGRGFSVGSGVVPIVPAAVVFDLEPLGRFDARPTAEMAHAACESASALVREQGSVGAGTGATVGKIGGRASAMKGGVGAAVIGEGGVWAGAVAVVNAMGDIRNAAGEILAGARDAHGRWLDTAERLRHGATAPALAPAGMQNTTIVVVATNAPLDRVAISQLAQASGAALFRRITPAGTSVDGDVIFSLCPHGDVQPADIGRVEALAVAALEQAIENAVRFARGRDGIPGLAGGDT
ncbi:MAG: peptidase DmpA [Gemmatimonadetes bacterium]|nr:peptidase DmpA [Gemmatimonadota bacterium]